MECQIDMRDGLSEWDELNAMVGISRSKVIWIYSFFAFVFVGMYINTLIYLFQLGSQ